MATDGQNTTSERDKIMQCNDCEKERCGTCTYFAVFVGMGMQGCCTKRTAAHLNQFNCVFITFRNTDKCEFYNPHHMQRPDEETKIESTIGGNCERWDNGLCLDPGKHGRAISQQEESHWCERHLPATAAPPETCGNCENWTPPRPEHLQVNKRQGSIGLCKKCEGLPFRNAWQTCDEYDKKPAGGTPKI